MSLAADTRLGPYEILGLIGVGGMGEVYKARDTRLDRTVAIKVLPLDLSADCDRRQRLEREAKMIAGLTHPNICTLHDVGEHDGTTFLVMELLEGESLARRLEKGALPVEQALTIASEIADALTAAHRHGIVHRDLKPGNVMLTKAGVKLLDFGLAKLSGHAEQDAWDSRTRSVALTGAGVIVGTLQYMAPEQLEGKPADARTDLWAFGALLYEMLTGKPAFAGESSASIIGAILERDPAPIAGLQPVVPREVERLVRRCLEKSPDERPDTAHDLRYDLRWLAESRGAVEPIHPHRIACSPTTRAAGLLVVGAILGGVLTAGWIWSRWVLPPSIAGVVRTDLNVRPAEELNSGGIGRAWISTAGGSRTALTWAPDGRSLIFVGRRGGVRQLYVRELEANEAVPLAGTEDAGAVAVSPDGRWVAFWAGDALKKMPLAGGPVVEVASGVPDVSGLIWVGEGRLLFGRSERGIWEVPVAGGVPSRVTKLGDTQSDYVPSFALPGDRTILCTLRKRLWSWGDEEVVALDLATGSSATLVRNGADARYAASGHLVFLRRGILLAVPFDAARLQITGNEVALIQGVAQSLAAANSVNINGAGQFAVSGGGSLAWVPGTIVHGPNRAVVAMDLTGQVKDLGIPAQPYAPAIRVSRDGRRFLVTTRSLTEVGLWVYDVGRPGILTPLSRRGEVNWPLWSRDGQSVVFQWLNEGRWSLAQQPADASRPPEISVITGRRFCPSTWTPDDRLMGVTTPDLGLATFEKPDRIKARRETSEANWSPELSPDGRWIAYASDTSRPQQIYVEAYQGPGGRTVISGEGFGSPAWHPDGRSLFFVSPVDAAGKRRMMVVDFEPGSPPRIGAPRELFTFDPRIFEFWCSPVRCYDVSPDGKGFFVVQTLAPSSPPLVAHINLVENWFAELKAKFLEVASNR